MKNDEKLIDSLLKEHAKMKKNGEHDEQFLKELEERLDAANEEGKIVAGSIADDDRSSLSRWGLGRKLTAVAACVAFGGIAVLSYQQFGSPNSQDVVLENTAAQGQLNDHADVFYKQSMPSSAKAKEMIESERARPEISNSIEKKPATPSANMANIVGATTPKNLPARPVAKRVPEPSIEFGDGDDFGNGWGSRRGLDEAKDIKKARRAEIDHILLDKNVRPTKAENTERYGKLVENRFTAPVDKESKRSTFAVDVDTASYTNLRDIINSKQAIPKDSVRIEELVNYFDYEYGQPSGEHPFAIHADVAACPWNTENKLVRIALQGKDIVREKRPASNIVFLLDVSGSMNNAKKLPLLKESMKYLLEELNAEDSVSIVVYAGASGLALPATPVTDQGRAQIMQTLSRLSAGGSTAGGQGIKLAYKVAKEQFIKDGVNRVILATDGDFNVGVSDTKALTEMVKDRAKDGVYLSVLGFGRGNVNDQMMESITNNGNGNYSYIDSIKEGRKVLLEDMMGTMVTIAKDVKIQVEFNPARVKEYRLIGYSNRVLPNAAFLDKTADAGEIGAGHTVTAFYEIVPGKAMDKAKLDALRYGDKKKENEPDEPAVEDNGELLYVKLAYKRPDQKMNDESTYFSKPVKDVVTPWDKVDQDFKFASSVALFGMVVRDSDYRGDGNLQLVSRLAEAGKGDDGKGYREEFIKLVEKVKVSEK